MGSFSKKKKIRITGFFFFVNKHECWALYNMKLPRNYQPHVMVFSMASNFYFLYYFIFFYLYTLLGLCGQLNKANKTLLLALLKI